MGKKKNIRLCSGCGYRHGTPTGKNCPIAGESGSGLNKDFRPVVVEKQDITTEGAAARRLPRTRSSSESSAVEHEVRMSDLDNMQKSFADRMDRLESLFTKSLNTQKEEPHRSSRHVASDSDYTGRDTSSDSASTVLSRRHRRRKSKKIFDQARFVSEGEELRTFEGLVLMTSKHLLNMLEHGTDPTHLIHHLKFMATKATLGHYKHEAFLSYDRAVRQRATKEAGSAFSDVLQEDVVPHFSPENMLPKMPSKVSKTNAGVQKKKSAGYCRAFNDGDCPYGAKCIFSHRCMACDEVAHGRKQCPSLKKTR